MKKLLTALAAVLILAPAPALAQGFAVFGQAGTTGLGGGIAIGLVPRLNVRGQFGLVPGDPEIDAEDVDWALDLPTFFLGTVDLYVAGGFHLSAGGLLVSDDGDITVEGTFEGQSIEFGGTTYTGSAADVITGVFSLESFMPYLGIGFGNPVGKSFGINFDLGVGFGETPTVTVTPSGPLADDPITGPQFRSDVQREVDDIQDDIPLFLKFYPVISLSISIGF